MTGKIIRLALRGLAGLAAATLLAGFLSRLLPEAFPAGSTMDGISALRGQAIALALLAAPALLVSRDRGLALAMGLGALGALAATPELFHAEPVPPPGAALSAPAGRDGESGGCPPLKAVTANLFQWNRSAEAATRVLLDLDADLLVLQEPPARLRAPQGPLFRRYPHRLQVDTGTAAAGPLLLSRRPLLARHLGIGPKHAVATLDPGGPCALTVATAHLDWPGTGAQGAEVEALAARLAAIHGPLAVMGDFNAAPWSRTLRQLSDRAGLRRRHRALGTYRGGAGGRGGAWFVPGGLPIDHILTRPGLAAETVRTIEIPGSDHLGLAATLRLTAAPPP